MSRTPTEVPCRIATFAAHGAVGPITSSFWADLELKDGRQWMAMVGCETFTGDNVQKLSM